MLELFNLFSDSKQAMKELIFNPANICGGGYKKVPLTNIFKRLEDNVVLQDMKGGVKLDNALTRDRL